MNFKDINFCEDVMYEHGIVRKLLVIYNKCIDIIQSENNPEIYSIVKQTALIIRKFVEEYHEFIEEEYIFPLFKNDFKYDKLIKELIKQHTISREITDKILELSDKKSKEELIKLIKQFNEIYAIHMYTEDLMIIRNVRKHISQEEFIALSKKFDEIEDELLGEHGFETILREVITIEQKLDINIVYRN